MLSRELEDVASISGRTQTLGRQAGVVDEHVDHVAAHGHDEVGDRALVAGVDGVDAVGDGPQRVGPLPASDNHR